MAAVVGVAAVALANALAVPLLLEALVGAHARTPPLLAAAAAGRFDADVPWPGAAGAPAGLTLVAAAYERRRCADPARLQRCGRPDRPRAPRGSGRARARVPWPGCGTSHSRQCRGASERACRQRGFYRVSGCRAAVLNVTGPAPSRACLRSMRPRSFPAGRGCARACCASCRARERGRAARPRRMLRKHGGEIARMAAPEHLELIPLVEVALAVMRLSCERFFVLASVLAAHMLFGERPPPAARGIIRLNHRVSTAFQRVRCAAARAGRLGWGSALRPAAPCAACPCSGERLRRGRGAWPRLWGPRRRVPRPGRRRVPQPPEPGAPGACR